MTPWPGAELAGRAAGHRPLCLADTLLGLDCPIVMVQGRLDQVAPGSAAEDYAGRLTAPSKQLAWFEHSAHMPQLEHHPKPSSEPSHRGQRIPSVTTTRIPASGRLWLWQRRIRAAGKVRYSGGGQPVLTAAGTGFVAGGS
jgi:hypothetical protein